MAGLDKILGEIGAESEAIVKDILGTGVDILAARSMEKGS